MPIPAQPHPVPLLQVGIVHAFGLPATVADDVSRDAWLIPDLLILPLYILLPIS